MSIQQQVVLRYRAEGHLRFDLPSALRGPGLGERLVAGLRALEGVYRVSLAERQGKLSIRYLATACDVSAIARRLHALVGELAAAAPMPDCCRQPAATPSHALQAPSGGIKPWLRAKAQEAKETTEALGILVGAGLEALNQQRPRWLTEFLNDLLMLYLIKLHWHHILYFWLPNPWRHRYEWMATFYLIYLSVQARLPKPA